MEEVVELRGTGIGARDDGPAVGGRAGRFCHRHQAESETRSYTSPHRSRRLSPTASVSSTAGLLPALTPDFRSVDNQPEKVCTEPIRWPNAAKLVGAYLPVDSDVNGPRALSGVHANPMRAHDIRHHRSDTPKHQTDHSGLTKVTTSQIDGSFVSERGAEGARPSCGSAKWPCSRLCRQCARAFSRPRPAGRSPLRPAPPCTAAGQWRRPGSPAPTRRPDHPHQARRGRFEPGQPRHGRRLRVADHPQPHPRPRLPGSTTPPASARPAFPSWPPATTRASARPSTPASRCTRG